MKWILLQMKIIKWKILAKPLLKRIEYPELNRNSSKMKNSDHKLSIIIKCLIVQVTSKARILIKCQD